MKVLMLAGVPPCHQYTGGLVIESLINFLSPEQIAFCAVVNSALSPEIPSNLDMIPRLILKRPREFAFRIFPKFFGTLTAYIFELIQALYVRFKLAPQITKFAKEQKIEALWVVLEGQTLIRLAQVLPKKLSIPLYTQVWDPFDLWLRSNKIDRFTKQKLLACFDKVINSSKSCATASWSMSESYTKIFNVKNQPLIAALPKFCAKPPALAPHESQDFIIGIAGQIYATEEWNCLVQALNEVNWTIANRTIRLRVLSGGLNIYTKKPAYIEYFGWQTQSDTLRILSECDLLYLPYWFSRTFEQETTYCFPSKLVTYFASGRPVLCHAPSYASPVKYIKLHKAGYVCESLNTKDVCQTLKEIILNKETYAKMARNGTQCFINDFTLDSMRDSFYELLGQQP